MFYKASIERECDKLNELRNVSYRDFDLEDLSSHMKADILISGADGNLRNNIVARLLYYYSYTDPCQSLVLTKNQALVGFLSTKENICKDGLIVSGFEKKNYGVFTDFDKFEFVDLIKDIFAIEKIDEIDYRNYLSALVSLLFYGKESTSLDDFLDLSQKNPRDLASLAENMGLARDIVYDLEENSRAARPIRLLAELLEEVFKKLSSEDRESYISYTNPTYRDKVKVFDMNSYRPDILKLYLTYLIEKISKEDRLRLVVDDMDFAKDDRLLALIKKLKLDDRIQIIVSSKNALNMFLGDKGQLGDFSNMLILPHTSAEVDENITSIFGEYTHFSALESRSKSKGMFFQRGNSNNYSMTEKKTLRISSDDLQMAGAGSGQAAIKFERTPVIFLSSLSGLAPRRSIEKDENRWIL